MTIQNLRWSYILLVNSLEVVRFPIKLGDYFDDVTTILGLLTVEGDEHKHQVRFLVSGFQVVPELLSNKTSSARSWSVMLVYWGAKRLTIG